MGLTIRCVPTGVFAPVVPTGRWEICAVGDSINRQIGAGMLVGAGARRAAVKYAIERRSPLQLAQRGQTAQATITLKKILEEVAAILLCRDFK